MATRKSAELDELSASLRGLLDSQGSAPASKKEAENEAVQRKVLTVLAGLAGAQVKEQEIEFSGRRMVVPEQYRGNLDGYIHRLREYQRAQTVEHTFSRVFKFRPWDVAHALELALHEVFGAAGVGKATVTMFGEHPPQRITIDVGFGKTREVPWGEMTVAPLSATIEMGATNDRDLGIVGVVNITAPKMYAAEIGGLFQVIETKLKTDSIYRGKAINAAEQPGFLDLSKFDTSKIVYSDSVMRQLEVNVWSVLTHSDALRAVGQPLSRKVVVEGPFGTGKSLAGMWTAQKAADNGWTFISVRPNQDNLRQAMKTAQVYAPAVVFVEDIDLIATTPQEVSALLDLFDGVGAKGHEVLGILTTNHVEQIPKGMLRPGRIDQVVHVGLPDAKALNGLVRAYANNELVDDYDEVRVAEAMQGFTAAWVAEAVGRTVRYRIAREGKLTKISTEDLVDAAEGLRVQLDLMNNAVESKVPPKLETLLSDVIRDTVHGAYVPGFGEHLRLKGEIVDRFKENDKHNN